ncbi:helix-turn-helix domain-containing protein [Deinococcus caeni]|uniref:helix-turn-helix domain-containing protein n=1 Tax=Deinococcus caeni TaxID=569127 RepID=UPI00360D085C
MEHALLDLRHRLYAELLRLPFPAPAPGERVVTPPPYHHVLAARIGCRREQVTREFTAMAAEGLVDRTRGALVLRRPDLLRRGSPRPCARIPDALAMAPSLDQAARQAVRHACRRGWCRSRLAPGSSSASSAPRAVGRALCCA